MNRIQVRVWGPLACFTRPELKVERASYDLITPSAAENLLSAIFWKPEIRYQVTEIHLLKPVQFTRLSRNELKSRQMPDRGPLYITKEHTPRSSLILQDVEYIIKANVELQPHATEGPGKYVGIFTERVQTGRSYHSPFLGLREFPAFFAPPTPEDYARTLPVTQDLGRMLLRMRFDEDPQGTFTFRKFGPDGGRTVRGRATPLFFHASLENGVLHVPER